MEPNSIVSKNTWVKTEDIKVYTSTDLIELNYGEQSSVTGLNFEGKTFEDLVSPGVSDSRTVGHVSLRLLSYLLLRSAQSFLDVDGQFPGGDPFPCLGHGSGCGGPTAVRLVSSEETRRQRKKE